ncbi:uncharacterized protein moto isoform 2-T3 [Syngnathus typhle]
MADYLCKEHKESSGKGDQSFKMASDELLFSSFIGQARVNGNDGSTSVSSLGFSPQEEEVAEFKLWSPSGHSDTNELSNCAWLSNWSRNDTEKNEIDEVALQCLVANILDEGDNIQSECNNSRKPSNANGLGSPETWREDFLQYCQPADTLPNYVPSELFIESQSVSKNEMFLQNLSGISANPDWFGHVNGDGESYDRHPIKSPPIFPISKTPSDFLPLTLESNYDLSSDYHPANHQLVNDFPQIGDDLPLQCKRSGLFFDHYESTTRAEPVCDNERYVPEHMNQLVSGLRVLMADEFNSGRCFPNLEQNTDYPEDSIFAQWKFPSQAMPMSQEKQPEGEFWGQNVKTEFKGPGFHEMSGSANANCFHSPSFNPPNQCQNIQRRNQCSNPRSKQTQHKMKSRKEKKPLGCFEESPQSASIHHRPHVDHLRGTGRFNGETPAHVNSNLGRFTRLSVKSEKDTTPHKSASTDMTTVSEAFLGHLKDAELHNGGKDKDTAVLQKNPEGLVIQFYLHLDECSEQLGYLEAERKEIEVILAKKFPVEWTPLLSPPPTYPPGLPLNFSRLDSLIVKQKKELTSVEWLLYKMEATCNTPLHASIHSALSNHRQALSEVQARRGEELANVSKRQRLEDNVDVIIALKALVVTTRKLRSVLWCAFQMTAPPPTRREEDHANANRTLCATLWHSLLMAASASGRKPDDHADTNGEETHPQSWCITSCSGSQKQLDASTLWRTTHARVSSSSSPFLQSNKVKAVMVRLRCDQRVEREALIPAVGNSHISS